MLNATNTTPPTRSFRSSSRRERREYCCDLCGYVPRPSEYAEALRVLRSCEDDERALGADIGRARKEGHPTKALHAARRGARAATERARAKALALK